MVHPTDRVTSVGNGAHKTLVIHGIFGGAQSWSSIWPYLDRSTFTYAFMDCRGFGSAKTVGGRYNMEEIAGDAIELTGQMGWDRFSLIGHSMGGMAVQRVLADAPDRVQKVLGISPVPADGMALNDERSALFQHAIADEDTRRLIIESSVSARLPKPWSRKMASDSYESTSRTAFAGYVKALENDGFAPLVQGLPHEVRVIIGEHDPTITLNRMKETWLTHYPNGSVEQMSNAGHYPMDETPLALVASIERFLSEEYPGKRGD